MFGLYVIQTIINKKWLNIILLITYFFFLGYVFYSYVYAFFDDHDIFMNMKHGSIMKTWETLLKVTVIVGAIWFTKKSRRF
jgi:hypothetical protein